MDLFWSVKGQKKLLFNQTITPNYAVNADDK